MILFGIIVYVVVAFPLLFTLIKASEEGEPIFSDGDILAAVILWPLVLVRYLARFIWEWD